jgi:hypothetical protein
MPGTTEDAVAAFSAYSQETLGWLSHGQRRLGADRAEKTLVGERGKVVAVGGAALSEVVLQVVALLL